MVHVVLPPGLIGLFPGCPCELCVRAKTVADMLDELDVRWPGMRDRLCDSTPAIRRHINVFINSERADLHTALVSGTEVVVMTAISGG